MNGEKFSKFQFILFVVMPCWFGYISFISDLSSMNMPFTLGFAACFLGWLFLMLAKRHKLLKGDFSWGVQESEHKAMYWFSYFLILVGVCLILFSYFSFVEPSGL